jgi:hypothetical protein
VLAASTDLLCSRVSTVDAFEFSALQNEQLNAGDISGIKANTQAPGAAPDAGSLVDAGTIVEFKPHFHEWATVQPGENTFHLSNVS